MSEGKNNSRQTKAQATKADANTPIVKPNVRAKGIAVVKAVLSGDSLVLMGGSNTGLPPEKVVILSGVTAPRFARGRNAEDEPYAYEAREFLRRKCIGRQVAFSVNNPSPKSTRDYADVKLLPQGEPLAYSLVKAGLAKVNTNRDGSVRADKRHLAEAQQLAESMEVGMWSKRSAPQQHVRNVDWMPEAKYPELFSRVKGLPLAGVVDYVQKGSTCRVELVDAKHKLVHTMITVSLAGVSCPNVPRPYKQLLEQWEKRKKDNPSLNLPRPRPQNPPAFSKEARSFTEARLMHRECRVVLLGLDKFNNLFGTVLVRQGNIAHKLLQKGFGKFIEWSASLTPEVAYLRGLEAKAIQDGLRIHKNYKPTEPIGKSGEFFGKVISVNSGDSVTVEDSAGEPQRLLLASIRAPRPPRGRDGGQAYGLEAKEYLRKRLIGKTVRVVYEYGRTAPAESNDQSVRQSVSIHLGKSDVGEELLRAGLATVLRHRPDEPRARAFPSYMETEIKAVAAGKNLHDKNKKYVFRKIIDLSQRAPRGRRGKKEEKSTESTETANAEDGEEPALSKARQYKPVLMRDRRLDAMVEYVFSATRMKLYVPKHNVYLTFALVGARLPRSEGKDSANAEIAKQATNSVRARLTQHNVKIEIESIDRGDNFIGSLFYGSPFQNLAVELLGAGQCELMTYSAQRSPHADAMFSAQEAAQKAEKNLWVGWSEKKAALEQKAKEESEEAAKIEAAKIQIRQGATLTMRLTEIVDGCTFFAVFNDDDSKDLIETSMKEFSDSTPAANAEWEPAKGSVCAGLYSDGSWYRVRVDSGNAKKGWKCFFIDFGNSETLTAESLRPLNKKLAGQAGLAKLCSLSALKAPGKNSEYYEGSMEALYNLTYDKDVGARIDFQDFRNQVLYVTITDSEQSDDEPVTVNSQMLRDGWSRVMDRPDRTLKPLVKGLLEIQETAKNNHVNIWEYGDVSDEEEEENPNERWGGGRVPLKRGSSAGQEGQKVTKA